MKTQEKMVIYKPRKESWNGFFLTALGRKQPYQHLDLGVLASRMVDNKFKSPGLWFVVMMVPANECRIYAARTSWKKIRLWVCATPGYLFSSG